MQCLKTTNIFKKKKKQDSLLNFLHTKFLTIVKTSQKIGIQFNLVNINVATIYIVMKLCFRTYNVGFMDDPMKIRLSINTLIELLLLIKCLGKSRYKQRECTEWPSKCSFFKTGSLCAVTFSDDPSVMCLIIFMAHIFCLLHVCYLF